MQTQKWVNLGLLAAGSAAFLFLSQLFAVVWDFARLPVQDWLGVEPHQAVGFLLAVALAVLARSNVRANGYFNEVVLEMSKVTWPVRRETVLSAGVVVVLVAIAAAVLFLIDTVWSYLIRGILT